MKNNAVIIGSRSMLRLERKGISQCRGQRFFLFRRILEKTYASIRQLIDISRIRKVKCISKMNIIYVRL